MLEIYLYFCLAIFVYHLILGVYHAIFDPGHGTYDGFVFTSTTYWAQVIGFSCPFLNIPIIGFVLYYYVATIADGRMK